MTDEKKEAAWRLIRQYLPNANESTILGDKHSWILVQLVARQLVPEGALLTTDYDMTAGQLFTDIERLQ